MNDGKRAAAEAGRTLLEELARAPSAPDPIHLGLGSGSTAEMFVRSLSELPADLFQRLVCVPTSTATRRVAESIGLLLADLNQLVHLHLTVDGADEIGPRLSLIKGGGGALLYEKIVADRSNFVIIVADATKPVPVLGKFPLPIELVPYGALSTIMEIQSQLATLGLGEPEVRIRGAEQPFITDSGNVICDVYAEQIDDPDTVAYALSHIPGVVEHGLFMDFADVAAIGDANGQVRMLAADVSLTDPTDLGAEPAGGMGNGDDHGPSGRVS